jgi:hypothetical protein
MKDARAVLDAVRPKVPSAGKMLVCWIDADGTFRAAQANMTQADVARAADALHASTLTMPGAILRAAA